MTPRWNDSLFLRAARRQAVSRPPVWLMRQAGRYLPEYRELRRKISFLDLCRSPQLCARIMLETVERLGVDAAIIFSDLLLILEPMGLRLEFPTGEGPVLGNPLAGDLGRLEELEDLGPLDYVLETVRLTRAGLDESLPLIGFAGAPFTLASYAIEGGASRDYQLTKKAMLCDEGAWHALMAKLARAASRFLAAQIAAGAQAVQLFDSWVGCLSFDDYRRYVLPHSRALIESLPPGVPVIHFATGNPALLPLLAEAAGARRSETVVGIDWRIRLDDAWDQIGHDMAVQGNLDPAALLGPVDEVRRRTQEVLNQAAGRPGHIFNLGHGVLPQTPLENVLAMIETVKERALG